MLVPSLRNPSGVPAFLWSDASFLCVPRMQFSLYWVFFTPGLQILSVRQGLLAAQHASLPYLNLGVCKPIRNSRGLTSFINQVRDSQGNLLTGQHLGMSELQPCNGFQDYVIFPEAVSNMGGSAPFHLLGKTFSLQTRSS